MVRGIRGRMRIARLASFLMGYKCTLVIERLHMDASDGGALAGRRMERVDLWG